MPDTLPPLAPEHEPLPAEEPPLDAEALLAMALDDRPRPPATGLRLWWERSLVWAGPVLEALRRFWEREGGRPRIAVQALAAWWARQTIRRKVELAGLLLDALVFVMIALFYPLRELRELRVARGELRAQAAALAEVLAPALASALDAGDQTGVNRALERVRGLPHVEQVDAYVSGKRAAFVGAAEARVPPSLVDAAAATSVDQGGSTFAAYPLRLAAGGSGVVVVEVSSGVLRRHLLVSVLFSLVLCGLLLAMTVLVTRVLTHGVLRPLNALTDTVGATTGDHGWDLTLRARAQVPDETSDFVSGFNRFLADTGKVVAGVKQVTARVMQSAAGMKTSLHGLSHSASALEDTIAQIANTAEDQLERLRQNLALAAESTQLADRMRESAASAGTAAATVAESSRGGREIAELARSQMAHISQRADETLGVIESLRSHSGRIDQVVIAIQEIAQQTNLLALNAAIEAARAGENGRGFAVVADEVRKLADQAAAYASEIGESIEAIRRDIGTAVGAVAKVDREVDQGSAVIASTAETFGRVVADIDGVARDVALIADLAQQQRQALTRVNESAAAIAQMGEEQALSAAEMSATMQEQTASTNEASAAAEGLNVVARDLQAQVDRIRI